MGDASRFIAPLVQHLDQLATHLATLTSAFLVDGDVLLNKVDHQTRTEFLGDAANAATQTAQRYSTLTTTSLQCLDDLATASRLLGSNAMMHAAALDAHTPNLLIDFVFNYGLLVLSAVLLTGSDAVTPLITQASTHMNNHLDLQEQADAESGRVPLISWADQTAQDYQTWYNHFANPTIGGGHGIPSLVGVTVDPQTFTNIRQTFDGISAPFHVFPSTDTTTEYHLTEAEYQHIVTTYKDDSTTQNLLFTMLSTSQGIKDYNAINSVYTNNQTRTALYYIINTDIGRKFSAYLLYMGQQFGDSFISWQPLSGANAYTTVGGNILMNSASESTAAVNAQYLVHEGVESYFATHDGYRFPASRQMDYVAEWYQGMVSQQMQQAQQKQYNIKDVSPIKVPPNAYQMSYTTWLNDHGDSAYGSKSNGNNEPDYFGSGPANGINSYFSAGTDRPGYAWIAHSQNLSLDPRKYGEDSGLLAGGKWVSPPNPMGLDRAMLFSTDLRNTSYPEVPYWANNHTRKYHSG